MISMHDACAVMAHLQSRVLHCTAQLRNATEVVAAARETKDEARAARIALAEDHAANWSATTDIVLHDYRVAAPDFAQVASLFPAANDEEFKAVDPIVDRVEVLCKLLKHGALGLGEIFEITRWERSEVEAALAVAMKAGMVLIETPNGMNPLYRWNVFFRPQK